MAAAASALREAAEALRAGGAQLPPEFAFLDALQAQYAARREAQTGARRLGAALAAVSEASGALASAASALKTP